MKLLTIPADWQGESAHFLEGAVLASNMAVKPLEPELWCEQAGIDTAEAQSLLVSHINLQHSILRRAEYQLSQLSAEELADLAEGFMAVWPVVEAQYAEIELGDGSLRMLQALLTTFMLAIDEEQTHQQMREAGIEQLPGLDEMREQLDLMVNEVAHAADEQMVGAQSQALNPYKDVGRNDICPCGSGKKFKKCCGR